MSVGLATLGMFQPCCTETSVVGGAPPYRQNAQEALKPNILVRNVEMETINSSEDYLKKIKVKLIDDE